MKHREIEYKADGDGYIEVSRWGRDHWSVLAYLETRAVDHKGRIDNRCMRCNPRLHRELVGLGFDERPQDGSQYPTRLKDGTLEKHDDWSCLEDMVAAGLIRAFFLRVNRRTFGNTESRIEFTELGLKYAGQLRAHKAQGGSYATFSPAIDSATVTP